MDWGKRGRSVNLSILFVAMVACAPGVTRPAPASSGDVLVGAGLVEFRNVYDAVAALRGSWLAGHATMACRCEPMVYVNGSKVRGLEVLRNTPMTGVIVRHLSSREAAARFGGGHEGGAILVEGIRNL